MLRYPGISLCSEWTRSWECMSRRYYRVQQCFLIRIFPSSADVPTSVHNRLTKAFPKCLKVTIVCWILLECDLLEFVFLCCILRWQLHWLLWLTGIFIEPYELWINLQMLMDGLKQESTCVRLNELFNLKCYSRTVVV